MNWELAGIPASIVVPLMVDGQYVQADAGSLKLTVRDNAGVTLAGYDATPLVNALDLTSVLVNLPGIVNAIDPAKEFETRFVRIDFLYAGAPRYAEVKYNLTNFLPTSVSFEQVRSLLGLQYQELPNGDIDIPMAYFWMKRKYGATFVSAMTQGGMATMAANRAIALRCALELFDSVPARMLKIEAENNASNERFKVDFAVMRAGLTAAFEEEVAAMLAAMSGATSSVSPYGFALSAPADVITGAAS